MKQSSESLHNESNKLKRSDCTQISKLTLHLLIKKIFIKFQNKYNHMPDQYETNIIDNIIYNDKSHIVSKFKDLLIAYDYSDYLKRYYTYRESIIRLPKYYEYYNLYSKIFPNYTSIPEGKYFYMNIQRKQRMIDLQEKIESENNNEKDKIDNVFNTSVVNSILNRTNKEEMEIIFDINIDKIKKNENIFMDKINKLINLINTYEIKEDYFIDYNYESKNRNNKNKDVISPLMNININYINFNKYNEDKTNSNSINNHSNKNNIFLYKIFNLSIKGNKKNKNKIKYNSHEKKDYSLFIMKINQLKKNKKVLNNMANYLKNKKLCINKNNKNHSFYNNQSFGSKKNRKNQTIVNDNRNKCLNNNNFIINRNNQTLKNIFSYKSSFGVMLSNKNNIDGISKLSVKSPLTSRNKKRNEDINAYLSNKFDNNNHLINNKKIISPQKDNKSLLFNKENKFYNLINNSRNKISLNNNIHLSMNDKSSKKYNFIQKSKTPSRQKIKLRENKKIKQNYSFLNKTVFKKATLINNIEKNNGKSKNILFNNYLKVNKLKKNNSILINKNFSDSTKANKLHHSNSISKFNKFETKNYVVGKNIKGVYINKFLKAFNNSIQSNKIFPLTHREYKK